MTAEPQWILDAARDFRMASAMLESRFGQTHFPLRSTVVTVAFAVELYLKYFAALASGTPPRGHDLTAVYDVLPDGMREELQRQFAQTVSFREALAKHADVFVEWRYIYEKQPGTFALAFRSLRLLVDACEAAVDRVATNHTRPPSASAT